MPLTILHTSDWHLGQKFLYRDRREEHQLALDWLYETIVKQSVDVLIVAGDIFDIGNPPSYARKLYYEFLGKLITTNCRHIIITGGNHDSPSMLEAPKDVLGALNIHIIGAVPIHLEEEIILLYDDQKKLEAVVAAVPFLRDRDLKYSVAGETGLERIQRIQEGIVTHYEKVAELMHPYVELDIPLITTGHLYVKGALASDKQDNIYIGNTENIQPNQFPKLFDYIALGHIHRPQILGGLPHIRYSGSIIPLSFSETKDEKSVELLQFEGKQIVNQQQLAIPIFRRLKTIEGELEYVEQRLAQLALDYDKTLPSWVEVIIQSDKHLPNINSHIQQIAAAMPLEVLKTRIQRLDEHHLQQKAVNLDDLLDPMAVFKKRCEREQLSETEMKQLTNTFRELMEWMQEKDGE